MSKQKGFEVVLPGDETGAGAVEVATPQSDQVIALADELSYQGGLSVGALEDGIRFYQRRSVEALLECGKRLLLLREALPKGNSQIGKNAEFESRLELLGFSKSTAYRFMQAAAKAAKSATVAVLAGQVKSASAFLELITHDDDALQDIAEMDDIDRLSASELRARLRHSEQASNRLQTDLNTAQSRLAAQSKVTAPPPLLSREADKHLHAALNAEAMGAAALDLLQRQVQEMEGAGDYAAEKAAALHSCLCAMASRVSMAFSALQAVADDCQVTLPPRPQMVVSEDMARDYLAAHTGYIETAIELAQKQLLARSEVLGRGPGRPAGSKNQRKGDV